MSLSGLLDRRDPLWRAAAWAPSRLYGAAVRARQAAYASGLLESVRLPVPVICVGNLTVGGTGKTPAVIRLCEHLKAKGKKPAVITRGYGGAGEGVRVVSDGGAAAPDARAAGDEPALIARRLPGVPVAAGADRAAAGALALEKFSPDVLVMDDGFQHFRLRRDLDAVCVDAWSDLELFERGGLLPAGRLREPLEGLGRARLVFLAKWNLVAAPDAARWEKLLHARWPSVTAVPARYALSLRDAAGAVREAKGLRLLALTGLARPESFERMLADLGADVAARRFPDHHFFTDAELRAASEDARRDGRELVVTEKDRVRLPGSFPCLTAALDWRADQMPLCGPAPDRTWTTIVDSVFS